MCGNSHPVTLFNRNFSRLLQSKPCDLKSIAAWNQHRRHRNAMPSRSNRRSHKSGIRRKRVSVDSLSLRSRRDRSATRQTVMRTLRLEHLDQRRVLAAITGAVFEDVNHSFSRDQDESNAPSRVVYIDSNDNAALDVGEPLALASPGGTFEFTDLDDGNYAVRLFNGSNGQTQTSPIGTDGLEPVTEIVDGDALSVRSGIQVSAGGSIVVPDLSSRIARSITVADNLADFESLPDGSILAIGNSSTGDTAWRVDLTDDSVTAVNLTGVDVVNLPVTTWSDLAIDGNGLGVVLEQSTTNSVVRMVDATDADNGIVVTTTATLVPADTSAITSATGSRTVFASPTGGGLDLSVWSNTTGTLISGAPTSIAGVNSLLDFDDASGLLAVRTADGGVSVLDVDADFAELHQVADADGPVAVDGQRDLLFSVSASAGKLNLHDLTEGTEIASLDVDFSDLGDVTAIALGDSLDSVLVLGSQGISQLRLNVPLAHNVVIENGIDPEAIEFGVHLVGDNTAPSYAELPSFLTNEDQPLSLPAPATLQGSADAENDTYLLIQTSNTSNGNAVAGITGSLLYSPILNFNGQDSFNVVLHDGRDQSETFTLPITVDPVPDPPQQIVVGIDPIDENLPLGDPLGTIEVIDGDGPGHLIEIDDPRFGEQGGQIILIGGPLDFETEPFIPLQITATDTETSESIETSITVTVRDANDPITGILPIEAFVFENAPGDVIAELLVQDQDEEQFHSFVVENDSRFIVDEFDLRLAPGIALDFETEQSVTVNVTATEVNGAGDSFTQAITVTVRNLPEQPSALSLTNQTVLELVPGAEVGGLLLDGVTPEARYDFVVDNSSFEVVDGTLKLIDETFVLQADADAIQFTITANDSNNEFNSVEETFVIQVLENQTPAHNRDDPYDVTHEGELTSRDALVILNYLNTFGPGPVGEGDLGFCYDVNADGLVTALDALLVVNEINRIENSPQVGGEGDQAGEGEFIPSDQADESEVLPLRRLASNSANERDSSLPSELSFSDLEVGPKTLQNAHSSSAADQALSTDDLMKLAGLEVSDDANGELDDVISLLSEDATDETA